MQNNAIVSSPSTLESLHNAPIIKVDTNCEPKAYVDASLFEVEFETFTDGRPFSVIKMIRRHCPNAKIIVNGAFSVDQIVYLQQCGANYFIIDCTERAEIAKKLIKTSILNYQKIVEG